MDFKEACHHLRVSPQLLKWFGSYSPKCDGRKLVQVRPGQFEISELDAFNSYLRGDWPNRQVPEGIQRELILEASGICPLCQQPCEKPQTAHINRKGMETKFYCQHPDNLILLCGTCHDRYDAPHLKAISLDVVVGAKERLISRKMEAIDRDVRLATAVRSAVDDAKAELRIKLQLATSAFLWQAQPQLLLNAAARGLFGVDPGIAPPFDPTTPQQSLQAFTGTLDPTQQVTHAVLDGYALEAEGYESEAPEEWELIDQKPAAHQCLMCSNLKDTVDYDCLDCGHFGSNMDSPNSVEENEAGTLLPVYSDGRGDSYTLACEECESENLEVSYPEAFCSYCAHTLGKDD